MHGPTNSTPLLEEQKHKSLTCDAWDTYMDRCDAAQATQHGQREAAHAADRLAQSQLQLQQSREAQQSAIDAQGGLKQERTTLLAAIGMHALLLITP